MIHLINGLIVKVTSGRSVMYGRLDEPEVDYEDRWASNDKVIQVGRQALFLETGQIVDFNWDSEVGLIGVEWEVISE